MNLLKSRVDHAENSDLNALKDLFAIRDISPQARMITAHILLFGDRSPTLDDLARRFGKTRMSIFSWVAEARALGLVLATPQPNPYGTGRHRHVYSVCRARLAELADGGE